MVGRLAPPRARPARADRERGSVLLETAIAIPVLLAVTVALAWGLSLVGTAAALGDAVRQVARDVARGVPAADAVAAAQAELPDATITVEDVGGSATVVARRSVPAPVALLAGLAVPLTQQVTVPGEWS